ncbi:MAG TPA: polysaccharide deacetylase family protein [Bryobacterales bacterium]|nr:polysaccharide deacetylase family protein [Bryobacterales bacterium]
MAFGRDGGSDPGRKRGWDTSAALAALAVLLAAGLLWGAFPTGSEPSTEPASQVPILVYHRFDPVAADGTTVTTAVFESQLRRIRDGGYRVIPLRELVACLRSQAPLPPRAVVLTADDGHRSIYTEMAPRIKRYDFPVTLFIYPSAISNATWAMTWGQLGELQATGLFELQSHTYWHPNFRKEQRLAPAAYEKFVEAQLLRSRKILEQRLTGKVDLLAWPFGIYDDWLMAKAQQAGYTAAFTLERRPVRASDQIMALPRFLVTNADCGTAFERLLAGGSCRQP